MRIKKISVKNLFDYYCYDIDLKKENISIIHAPNGYGKTTVFRMISHVLYLEVVELYEIPFSDFIIEFSDDIIIKVNKQISKRYENCNDEDVIIDFKILQSDNIEVEFEIPISRFSCDRIKEYGLDEYLQRLEVRRRHGAPEDREHLINYRKRYDKYCDYIIKKHLKVNYIDSNRLFDNTPLTSKKRLSVRERFIGEDMDRYSTESGYDGGDYRKRNRNRDNESIVRDAENILEKIREARHVYGLEAEKKDRNFPDRLVSFVNSNQEFYNDKQIKEHLAELENKRVELESAGLVLPGAKTLNPSDSIDDTMRKFYTLYIKDTMGKLSLYDDIMGKLKLFMEIINGKTSFSNKTMYIDNEKGVVFEPIKSNSGMTHSIPLEKLSSGEKHDFIMFYELIFNSDRASVFLIDEPEISLHVAWQMEFIDVLNQICGLNGAQAIIATHSPDIVNGHDDLLISLGLEEDK